MANPKPSGVRPISPAPPPAVARDPLGPTDEREAWVREGESPPEAMERLQAAVVTVVNALEADVRQRVNDRTNIESNWLQALRQYHGVYEPNVQGALDNEDERSKVFINMTRPKTIAWEARLSDLLFPADGKNWGINPTPVPELVDEANEAVDMKREAERKAIAATEDHAAMMDQGAPPEQMQAKMAEAEQYAGEAAEHAEAEKRVTAVQDVAAKRATAMEREIDDALVECNWAATSRDIIGDACKLGVGVAKGPITTDRNPRKWTLQQTAEGTEIAGQYVLARDADQRPEVRRVDPWNFFPQTEATCMADCESTFERHIKNKSQLRKMTKSLGFDEETVKQIIRDGPGSHSGSGSDLNHLVELRTLGADTGSYGSAINDKFIVWEYHGPLEIKETVDLLDGLGDHELAREIEEEDNTLSERLVVAYFCNGKLLKLAPDYPMESGENLYSVFPFERAEASILGAIGIPWMMRHEQAMLNSAVRMMIDNGALSAGPQIIIDKTQVEPENGSWKLTPRKIWKRSGGEVGKGQVFEVANIPLNQAQLAGIIEMALKFIDMVISMPLLAQGEQGEHQQNTMGGMSMLFNSANVVFRRVVKNWDDDITTPVIGRMYDWEMQHSAKEEIKGDMKTEARGTSVLLVREIQSQQLMAIATQWSTHPIIAPAVRVYEALSMTLQAMSISPSDILVSPDEFEKRVQAMAEGQSTSPEQINAEARIKVAEISAKSRLDAAQLDMEKAGIDREVAIMGLISKEGVDMARVETMLEKVRLEQQGKERAMAAEIGVERQAQEEARAQGRELDGSGGYVNLASKPRGTA